MRKRILLALIALIGLLTTVLWLNTTLLRPFDSTRQPSDSTLAQAPSLRFGIPIDSFAIAEGVVRRHQTLGAIFASYGIGGQYIRQLSRIDPNVFNIRTLRAGNPYLVFTRTDTSARVEYFVYEHSVTDYVRFRFADSLLVEYNRKEVTPVTRTSEAVVSSSLWGAMEEHSINPTLALELSEIFAWTVDFFGLHPGDRFRAIYDELYVDSTSVGIGAVHAVWFEHRGQRQYAFRFMQDSVWSYWDQEGNSLRRAFLKAPLRFSRISSRFTHRRLHPVLRVYRPHTGVDYAAPEGTPVMALGDGVVVAKGYNHASGNYVRIRHNSVYTTGYLHFSRFGKGIARGVRVTQGQVIGYVGSTGHATGPHLCLRFWKNGQPVDPLRVEAPPVEPIKPEYRPAFEAHTAALRAELERGSPRPTLQTLGKYLLLH